jgi:hypothetical protein
MGMYDTIQFDIDILPVPREEKELLVNEEFQTKSLDNALVNYRITREGNLEYVLYSGAFSKLPGPPIWKRVEESMGM